MTARAAFLFPVALLFEIDPSVARNFSLAIQSIGMTAAALWIVAKRIPIEKTYLWVVAGGTIGIIFGTCFIAPYVVSPYAKMMFVSFWMRYGIARSLLYWGVQFVSTILINRPTGPLIMFSLVQDSYCFSG